MPEIKVQGQSPIFAVDDDPMFQEILQFAYSLSEMENELIPFQSGYECIEALNDLRARGGTMPSMILMDINMPGMNGIETVRKIRSDDDFQKIPIITMLSSSNDELDLARSKDAGANDYCEKPFDITSLKFVNA